LFSLGTFLINTEVAQILRLFFPRDKLGMYFDKGTWLGYTLGVFFTNSCGHPGPKKRATKIAAAGFYFMLQFRPKFTDKT
jgi:hypothetical protein